MCTKWFRRKKKKPKPIPIPTPITGGDFMIAVVNQSTRGPVTKGDIQAMVDACNNQLKFHVAPAYQRNPVQVVMASSPDTVPPNAYPIYIFSDSDQPGALGYHTEDPNGKVYGRVFAGPVLDNGGGWTQDNGTGVSVSSVLSHEVIELFVDPYVNLWAAAADNNLYAVEACDPVESSGYLVAANSKTQVLVSNFVFPEWFDSSSPPGTRYDHLKRLSSPFTLDAGGYVILQQGGAISQRFGEHYPDWRNATKSSVASRTYRRLNEG